MTHGLVVRNSAQISTDAYQVSRLGSEALMHGIDRLTAAERLGVSLHSRIAQRVEQQFLLGEYELAVFAAMREVEIRVREIAGFPDSQLGTALMQNALSPTAPGPLTDLQALEFGVDGLSRSDPLGGVVRFTEVRGDSGDERDGQREETRDPPDDGVVG